MPEGNSEFTEIVQEHRRLDDKMSPERKNTDKTQRRIVIRKPSKVTCGAEQQTEPVESGVTEGNQANDEYVGNGVEKERVEEDALDTDRNGEEKTLRRTSGRERSTTKRLIEEEEI